MSEMNYRIVIDPEAVQIGHLYLVSGSRGFNEDEQRELGIEVIAANGSLESTDVLVAVNRDEDRVKRLRERGFAVEPAPWGWFDDDTEGGVFVGKGWYAICSYFPLVYDEE